MTLNDRNLGVTKGVDVYDGVSNPTTHSIASNPVVTNFVCIPTRIPHTIRQAC